MREPYAPEMKYVLDACNLIFHSDDLYRTLDGQGFQAARAQLVDLLEGFVRRERLDPIVAVFDGSEKGAHLAREQREAGGRVVLIYANPRDEADRVIVDLVECAQRPGQLTVVSDDKFVVREVKKARGHTLGCSAFLKRVRESARDAKRDPFQGEDPRKYAGLADHELKEWTDLFGFKDDE
ncbi:MAG: NYN domain-containing protein [Planctomycetes bacterium]|nr:NYN domain-containing protein [Planctomycetota bacterium]